MGWANEEGPEEELRRSQRGRWRAGKHTFPATRRMGEAPKAAGS